VILFFLMARNLCSDTFLTMGMSVNNDTEAGTLLTPGKKFSADGTQQATLRTRFRFLPRGSSDGCYLLGSRKSVAAKRLQGLARSSVCRSAQHSASGKHRNAFLFDSTSSPLSGSPDCHMLSRGWHTEDGPLPTAWRCSMVGCCTLSDMVVAVATMALARSCHGSIDYANGCCLPGSAEPSRGHDLWSRFGTTDLREPSK
jgi:hypothetical protein